MRKVIFAATCLAVSVVMLFAADEQQPLNVKTGSWQVEYLVKYSGLPPQYQAMMDQLTEQQKSAMGLPTAKTLKLCVKQKDLNKPWSGDNDCRWKVVKSTSSELDAQGTSCRNGSTRGSSDLNMDIQIHAIDSENVHATLHGTATMEGGNKMTLDGSYVGKWLSSMCEDSAK